MSKKVTQKVHSELRAARQAKAERSRQAKQGETGGEQHPEQDHKETPVAAKGREHTIAKPRPHAGTRKPPEEPPVELIIDAEGIHSLTAGARPAEKAPKAAAKAHEPQARAETPKQEDDSQEEVVFALRLRRQDRDLLHEKAGSGKASRMVRQLIVAAAQGDREGIEQVLTQMHGTSR